MKKAAIVLLACILILFSSCTDVEIVDLDVTSDETINTTKLERNESGIYVEEGPKELPEEVKEGMCTEKVLLAIRKCRWRENASNLGITIKNNGFRNVTIAFYLFDDQGQVGSIFNDTLFIEKDEWTFTLPFAELEEQYGEIVKIHATPILTEDNESISCSNKKLPVLVSGCS